MNSKPVSLAYDLRLGVVGHRNLDDPAAVRTAVDRVLGQLRSMLESASHEPFGPHGVPRSRVQRFDALLARCVAPIFLGEQPNGSPANAPVTAERHTGVGWTIISPLAKGADRIVARAGLDQPDSRLEVVTPLPVEEYRRDFADGEDRQEFETLLARDFQKQPTVLGANWDAGAKNEEARQAARNEAYAANGRFVVDACEILIAIWDGKPVLGVGGTAQTVEYALKQGRKVIWIQADTPDADPQWLSLRPADGAKRGPIANSWSQPVPQRAKQLSLGFHRLSAFQRDTAFDARLCEREIGRERQRLLDIAQRRELPGSHIEPILATLLPHYERANQLAQRYQELYVVAANGLFRLSATAVTVVVVQLLFFPHQLWIIAFEIGAMLAALALLRVSRIEAWHEKWLYDRQLAEWLRSAMFLSLIQENKSVAAAASSQLPFYVGPDNWFMDAYAPLLRSLRDAVRDDLPPEPVKRFLLESWIECQADWHEGNARKKHRAAQEGHQLGLWFFGLTLLMATLHLLGVGHEQSPHEDPADWPATAAQDATYSADDHHSGANEVSRSNSLLWRFAGLVITLLAIVLPVWGAAEHAIGNLLDYDRIAVRSQKMAEVLRRAALRAGDAPTEDLFREEIRRVAKIMVDENQEWLASLSFHGLVLPA